MSNINFEPGDVVETEDGLRLYVANYPDSSGLYSLTCKSTRVNEMEPSKPHNKNCMTELTLYHLDLGRWRGSIDQGYSTKSLKFIRKPTAEEISTFNNHSVLPF